MFSTLFSKKNPITILFVFVLFFGCGGEEDTYNVIYVGSKNYTEQFVLGELMAQLIEFNTDINVERRFNLGGTMICHNALINGEIHLYAEYTGTALTTLLNMDTIDSPTKTFQVVETFYRDHYACEWLEPFGFNNTYAITVRKADADSNNWEKISDLIGVADTLRAGFTAEFIERPDGYPGLREAYGIAFKSVSDLDPGLMYDAIVQKEVDVICAFATDGRIPAFNLVPLKDDRHFFPPYQAAPVVRNSVLAEYPQVEKVLNNLGGLLDDKTMQNLNYEVDENQRSAADVAREFLESKDLIDGT